MIDIDALRKESSDKLAEIGREMFGVELQGTKVQRLRMLEKLAAQEADARAAGSVATTDVTLETIRGPLTRKIKKSKLVLNVVTGNVFPFSEAIAVNRDIEPYDGVPVLVQGHGVMDPEYAARAYPDNDKSEPPAEFLVNRKAPATNTQEE
jgi:hypothetical protein